MWRPVSSHFEYGLNGWIEDETEPKFMRLTPGDTIKWMIRGPRICTGYHDDTGIMHRCPDRAVLMRGRTQCGPCSGLDYFVECIRCNGSVCNASPKRREECKNKDYIVYLAVFANGKVKVGVSTKNRIMTRWVEQGADFAGAIAEVRDGKIARQIESKIGRLSNFTTVVSRRQKAGSLLSQITLTEAQQLVDSVISDIPADIVTTKEIELVDLTRYYELTDLDAMPHPWNDGSHTIDGLSIIGEIVSMKGSILVTRNGTAFQYLNLRDLVAYTIESDDSLEVATQAGLLDYF